MALPVGPQSYVVLWSRDRCREVRRAGDEGKPLEVVYGGAHTSQPLLSRYRVRRGHRLYPISVHQGALLIIAGMTVEEIIDWREYVVRFLGVDERWLDEAGAWDAAEKLGRLASGVGSPSSVGLPGRGGCR